MFPCSPAVAAAMVRDLDRSNWKAVVELGPGNGVLTPTLIEGLPASCRFIAIELSESLSEEFHQRLPEVEIVQGDAAELVRICGEHGVGELDAVFSALPLRLLPPAVLQGVLASVAKMLRPGGVFAQVTYWPAALTPGKHMREQVSRHIGPVESDRLVAGNAPPAWIFRCIRERGQA